MILDFSGRTLLCKSLSYVQTKWQVLRAKCCSGVELNIFDIKGIFFVQISLNNAVTPRTKATTTAHVKTEPDSLLKVLDTAVTEASDSVGGQAVSTVTSVTTSSATAALDHNACDDVKWSLAGAHEALSYADAQQ